MDHSEYYLYCEIYYYNIMLYTVSALSPCRFKHGALRTQDSCADFGFKGLICVTTTTVFLYKTQNLKPQ